MAVKPRLAYRAFCAIALIMSAWARMCPAQAAPCLKPLGRWGYGLSYAVASDGRHAYVGNGSVLQIYAVVDPANPRLTGEVMLDGLIRRIVLSDLGMKGYYAFVAVDKAGMAVVDISDPSHPITAGLYSNGLYTDVLAYAAWNLVLKDNFAYILDSDNYPYGGSIDSWLEIVDVSNPRVPVLAKMVHLQGAWRGLAIYSNYLFVTDGSRGARRIDVIDVRDPGMEWGEARIVSTIPISPDVTNIALQFLSGRVYAYSCDEAQMYPSTIVEVTDPLHPVMIGQYYMGAIDLTFCGRRAYASDFIAGFYIFDASDPSDIHYLGGAILDFHKADQRAVSSAVVDGKYAFVAGFTTFAVLDVRVHDSGWPLIIADVGMGGWSFDIVADGTTAYVSSDLAGVRILDFSDPLAPRELNRIITRGQVNGMMKEGDLLYVADNPYISIYNVADPASPVELGYYNTKKMPYYLAKTGDHLFVTCPEYGLIVLNVGNPAKPFQEGQLKTGTDPFEIAILGNYAYVADSYYGMSVYDITNPALPRLVWTQGVAGPVHLAVSGPWAYVANWYGLSIFSLQDPVNPRMEGYLVGKPVRPVIKGNVFFAGYHDYYMWGNNPYDGIWATDVTYPLDNKDIGYIFTQYYYFLGASGNVLYATNPESGVAAFDISGCTVNDSHTRPLGIP